MEANETTPDKKLKSLLSSFICKPQTEKGSKRKRSITDIESSTDENGVLTSDKEIQPTSNKRGGNKVDSQDEEAYFERVESYSMMLWFAKPPELSPLICSRYGWKNTERDILQCVGCKAVLCGQLPKNAESLIYHESSRKLIDNLRTAHQKSCFWPAYPSSESYSTIPIKDKRKVTSLITEYIDSLQKFQDRLPQISLKSFEDKGMSANYLEEMKCTAEKHLEHCYLDNIDLGTFCLAVTGWKISDDKSGLLSCHYCRRKVGLWNYKNKRTDSVEDSSEESDIEIKSPERTNSLKNITIDVETRSNSDNQTKTISPERPAGTAFENSSKIQQTNPNQDEIENSRVDSQTSTSPHKIYNFSQPSDLDCSVADNGNETNEAKVVFSSNESKEENFVFSQPESCGDLEDFESDKTKNYQDSWRMEVCNDNSETLKNETKEVDVNGALVPASKAVNKSIGNNSKTDICEKQTEIESNRSENLSSELQNNIVSGELKNRLNGENSQQSLSSHNGAVTTDNIVLNSDVQSTSVPLNIKDNNVTDQEEKSSLVHSIDTAVELKRKRIKAVKKESFDPLEEHRYWCPWINKLPEKISFSPQKISDLSRGDTTKSSYPWEHVLQIISPTFFDASQEDSMSENFKQHSPVAGLRQLRKLMKDWSN